MTFDSPQNPYTSLLVSASAGSGKTYQLTRRFIQLVGAGANPAKIVTITFTIKAANEMRTRILCIASKLLSDHKAQREYEEQAKYFFELAKKEVKQNTNKKIPIPLPARVCANKILAASQRLRISTIDSLFKEWTDKFPWESQLQRKKGQSIKKSEILSTLETNLLNEQAWEKLFSQEDQIILIQRTFNSLEDNNKGGILALKNQVFELFRYHTYLWQCERTLGYSLKSLYINLEHPKISNFNELIRITLKEHFKIICSQLQAKSAPLISEYIIQGNLEGLIKEGLLTKDLRISAKRIRGKKREQVIDSITYIEQKLRTVYNFKCLYKLEKQGKNFFLLYQQWINEREKIKKEKNILEFFDLTIGAFKIFHEQDSLAAAWFLQKDIDHLLIDEFQDTSLLQWSVIEQVASELLSGEGDHESSSIPSTIFIVGDKKQSIYGFREAEPRVMELAEKLLLSFEKKSIRLNHSYRTCQGILDFINQSFTSLLPEAFPLHQAAKINNKLFRPRCSQIILSPLFEKKREQSATALEQEARFVVEKISHALKNPEEYPVWDVKSSKWRPLESKDCCILYRSTTHISLFESALRKAGIAHRKHEQKGFFARSEIEDLIAFFQWLNFPEDETALISFLKSPFVSVSDQEIISALHFLSESKEKTRLPALLDLLSRKRPSLKTWLMTLLKLSKTEPSYKILSQVISETRALQAYIELFPQGEGDQARKDLLQFLNLILELTSQGFISCKQCLEKLLILKEEDSIGLRSQQSQEVSLMTIHKAKGLEFTYLALICTGESWFKEDPYWIKDPEANGFYYMGRKAEHPIRDLEVERILGSYRKSLEAESLRLLYVALTRTSQYLLISGHKPYRPSASHHHQKILEIVEKSKDFTLVEGAWIKDLRIKKNDLQKKEIKKDNHKRHFILDEKNFSKPFLNHEIKIIQPHSAALKTTEKKNNVQKKQTKSLASASGIFIHKAFEYNLKKKEWNPRREWENIVQTEKLCLELNYSDYFWKNCYKESLLEIEGTLNCPNFRNLINSAKKIYSELPFVHLDGTNLINGIIDLCLDFGKKIILIDFKTIYIPEQFENDMENKNKDKDIFEHLKTEGFHHQLWHYVKATGKLFPNKKIEAYIWLTKSRQMIKII